MKRKTINYPNFKELEMGNKAKLVGTTGSEMDMRNRMANKILDYHVQNVKYEIADLVELAQDTGRDILPFVVERIKESQFMLEVLEDVTEIRPLGRIVWRGRNYEELFGSYSLGHVLRQ